MIQEINNLISDLEASLEYIRACFKAREESRGCSDQQRLAEIDNLSQSDRFWDDPATAQALTRERSELASQLDMFTLVESESHEFKLLFEEAVKTGETDMLPHIKEAFEDFLHVDAEGLKTDLMFSENDEDRADCYLEVHAGAGGTESTDWAGMLLRMYKSWAGKDSTFSYNEVEVSPANNECKDGIKSGTIRVYGTNAYGWLKGETGIHRLMRISPFDSSGRRHTSFASVNVYPDVDRSVNIKINESDLEIQKYIGSGPGGQHRNKTESCVRITHKPTGIVVRSERDRSQHNNRAEAMRMLEAKLYQLELDRQQAESDANRIEREDNSWGNAMRTVSMEPYQLVKDKRTGVETGNVGKYLDGDIYMFLEGNLQIRQGNKSNKGNEGE